MNRSDFQELAELRIKEAMALLATDPPMPDGAYYLAGYAVECALKSCISKLTREFDFPPDRRMIQSCYSHDFADLVRAARLEDALKQTTQSNAEFAAHWQLVKDWNESSRYERRSLVDGQKLIQAITHDPDGVLPWLKAHW